MSDETQARGRVVGTLRSEDGRGVVRMEDRCDTERHDLWTALTDPARLARWIATVEGELRAGGEFRASFTSGWEGTGRVQVCDPPRRLLVTMTPDQGDDETVIEAALYADGDHTRLVIEERGLPLGELAAYGAGWQAHIEDLAAHLDGRERGDLGARWTELISSYRELAARLA